MSNALSNGSAPSRADRGSVQPPRPRWRAWVTGTVITATAVLIGLSGAGVTQAYLTASASQPGATLTAGTAAIQVNGVSAANLGSRGLTPNTPAVWSFTVSNTGSVKMDISAVISAPAAAGYATSTRAVLAPVSGAAACTASLGGTPQPFDGFTASTASLGAVQAGAVQTYCLVVSLPSGTSAVGSGSPLAFSMTVDAVQSAS